MNLYIAIPDFLMKLITCIAICISLLVLEILFGWLDVWHWLKCWHERNPGFPSPVKMYRDFMKKIEVIG